MTKEERKRCRNWKRLWKASEELRLLSRKYKSLGLFYHGFSAIEESLSHFSGEEILKFKLAEKPK